jgi:hypothetical protein
LKKAIEGEMTAILIAHKGLNHASTIALPVERSPH